MFVYLLIAAELGVLYTVYWYLFLYEPQSAHKISAGNRLWGRYERPVDYLDEPDEPFADELASDYILDLRTNHYVRISRQARLECLARQIDRAFAQLKVNT
jgi:hypothetical protein